ncbi:TPA: phosphotransferase [Proteus mirabilis]|uniref:Choline kinase n=2 Tax=Proteus mirabilis TaxID=584 RepID=A0A385JMD7_PROMI|nr:choline/ethanolamine kinase family protein [Proteus mirabilis]AXY99504.1 choline kinase [Proteus mirabilis]ELL8907121.1 phosphotransferase family protein [Proteus mirabilis]MBB6620108.1 phosphotransferase family protein [Proteus mirabilis]MBG2852027.1 phosphotransferase family protein [Proteus mirabilis]MBN4087064.1 phosphotransferase family protein [Proteus mirabilis]
MLTFINTLTKNFMINNSYTFITKIVNQTIAEPVLKIKKIGGMTNTNYYCETLHTKAVVRLPGENTDVLINRKNEKLNCQKATKIGINPKLYYFNIENGIKITEYINNAITLTPETIHNKNILKNIALLLKKLHHSNIVFENKFNVFDEYRRYSNNLRNIKIKYPNFKNVEKYFLKLEKRIDTLGVNLSPCHNDTVPENFIYNQYNYYLIDWEYSGMNDSIWDIAALFEESNLSKNDEDLFLTYYLDKEFVNYDKIKEKIIIYKICQNFLWSIWTIIKEQNNSLFGNYGIERYNKCQKQIELHETTYASI